MRRVHAVLTVCCVCPRATICVLKCVSGTYTGTCMRVDIDEIRGYASTQAQCQLKAAYTGSLRPHTLVA